MSTATSASPLALRDRPLRVLLVDDSAADVALMEEVFGGLGERVSVTVCTDAPAMFAFLRSPGRALPDVALLDLHLAGRSGLDVLAELKGDLQLSYIPVVILSGSTDPRDIRQAYAAHASAYLVKPMSLEQMQAQMTSLVTFWTLCGVIG